MNSRVALTAAALMGAMTLACAQSPVVAKFTAARNAQITKGPVATSRVYTEAKVNGEVREGYGVRTFRRSFAELTFVDGSALRVNEQTDLIVQSVRELRRVRLEKGALWVKDEKGSRTSVQTPVATATARGTVFVVTSEGTVAVHEGEVELEAGGTTIVVGVGEIGRIGPDGVPSKSPLSPEDNPWYDEGGNTPSFLPTSALTGLLATQLSSDGNRQRESAVPEPATVIALGLGAAALLARRRRQAR